MNRPLTAAALALVVIPAAVAGDPLPAGAVARLGSPRWRGVFESWGPGEFRYTPDGSAIVCRMAGGSVAWLDADTGRELRRIRGPFRFRTFAVTPDGTTLITTDDGPSGPSWGLRLWNVATGAERKFIAELTAYH